LNTIWRLSSVYVIFLGRKHLYATAFAELVQRCEKCVKVEGDYFERYRR
jgi:hypothetical protein